MVKSRLVIISLLLSTACSPMTAKKVPPTASREARLDCEQEALVAKSSYLARIKIPAYESNSKSTTWQGGARTDSGEWVFNTTYRTCLQHAAGEQP